MKKMVLNKKGQGLPTSTLVLMIIAIIVLVFVVLGFVTGWNFIFDKTELLPDDVTTALQACTQYASSASLKLSYCQLRELEIYGKDRYVNCDQIYKVAVDVLGADKIDYTPGTGDDACKVLGKDFCINNELSDNTIIGLDNAVTCKKLKE